MPPIKCRTTTKSCGWLKILLQFSYNFAVFSCYLWIKQSKSLTLDFMTDGLLVNYYYEIAHIATKSRCVGFPTMLIKKAVHMQISTGRPNSNVDASCPKGISLHVAALNDLHLKFCLENYQLSGALGVTHYSKIMSLALVNAKKLIIECSATAYTMYIDKKYAHTLQEPASRT